MTRTLHQVLNAIKLTSYILARNYVQFLAFSCLMKMINCPLLLHLYKLVQCRIYFRKCLALKQMANQSGQRSQQILSITSKICVLRVSCKINEVVVAFFYQCVKMIQIIQIEKSCLSLGMTQGLTVPTSASMVTHCITHSYTG